jgi:two-component system chemotaxis sensor kinase CheA
MENDETLQMFLEEARDHLRDIETDLLGIETETGPADVERVNTVFRGIHSIKGAAGFFGLNRIKDLSHSMENLLNRIRNLELLPDRRVIEALLRSADVLSAMVEDPHGSEAVDIQPSLALLGGVQEPVARDTTPTQILDAVGMPVFSLPADELHLARKGGKNLFVLHFDMVSDLDEKGKTPLDVLRDLERTGLIVDSRLSQDAGGNPVGSARSLPFHVLYATVLDLEMTSLLTGLEPPRIHPLPGEPEKSPVGPEATEGTGTAKPSAAKKSTKAESAKPARKKEPAAAPPAPDGAPAAKPPDPPEAQPAAAADPVRTVQPPSPSSSLRVNVKVLDRLMTLAGELVLSRNQLVQKVSSRSLADIQASSQGLSLIISELQEAVMSTRMQPLSIVFGKFQRLVRDLAGEIGKEIRLEVEGEDVELDKTVIESIGDPLTHLIRNSVDHGIEPTDVREREGKPRQAVIRLHAFHEAGKVVIAVSDDGRGIDTAAVRAKALAQQIADPQQIAKMTEKELINLIFLPGFSTAKKVTDISGRGVGMDVVKTNFTKLGGVIDVESRAGKGTTIRVKLPLTLAIIPSLMVSVQDETYAIPQVNLVELVRIPAREVRNRIERVGDALVMRLRGNLLPLLRLSQVLGLEEKAFEDPESGEFKPDRRRLVEDRRGPVDRETQEERERRRNADRRYHSASAVNIAVLSSGAFQYGLVVDRLHESEEIVVKPLGRHFHGCQCYAGATILGDGRVSLILDVVGITRHMDLRDAGGGDRPANEEARTRQKLHDAQSMLLFRVADHEQFAVPLALVLRLEVVQKVSIEEIGGRRSTQYRGGTLPLLDLSEISQVHPLPDLESYFAIVYSVGGREVGLLASQIVDIVESSEDFDETTFRQPGILGSTIVQSHTTLLVDLFEAARTGLPGFAKQATAAGGKARRILVVDDSPFYRRQISGFLREFGHEVHEAENGERAFSVLETVSGIDLVLTDVEMPVMDGLELARRIRSHQGLKNLAVVAVSSLSNEEAMRRGRDAGLDGYIVKLDREKILESVEKFLVHGRC